MVMPTTRWHLHLRTKLTEEQKHLIYGQIADRARSSRGYYAMAALSAVIAAFGLLSNSSAVVIGAMLLAPLMGPIFGITLGLTLADTPLLRKAALAEFLGVILVIALSCGIGLIPWRMEYGAEIISRTHPTFYDILIALAAGLAGTYALLDERISSSLTGVAIATALVPPLTTCGLCLATGQWEGALGAFLLFFANFLAIQVAAAVVFMLFGMHVVRAEVALTPGHLIKRLGISLVLLMVVSVLLIRALYQTISDNRLSHRLQIVLSQAVGSTAGARLSDVTYRKEGAVLNVMAVVLTPQEFAPENVSNVEKTLRKQVQPNINLIIRSLISKDADNHGPVFMTDKNMEASQEQSFLTAVSQTLQRQLQQFPGTRLVDLRREQSSNGNITVTAVIRTPFQIEPMQVAEVEKGLQQAIAEKPHLIIRSIITRDADAQQYLYQPQVAPKLSGDALRFHQRLESALTSQLRRKVPGASLKEFRYVRQHSRLILFAVVRAPRSVEPEQVRKIEAEIRWYIDPLTDVIIRSEVGADTGSAGYFPNYDESQLER